MKQKKQKSEAGENTGEGRPARPFYRRADVLVIVALLAAAVLWLALSMGRGAGLVATVSTAGDEPQPMQSIRLDRDGEYHIEGALPVTLEVADGAIRFVNSVCPDHVCENTGWLRYEGDWALCAPAGVMVRVDKE